MISKENKAIFKIFMQLLCVDLKVFKRSIFDKIIDMLIYILVSVGITVYILPSFGLAANYSMIIISGMIASVGIFDLYPNAVGLGNDLNGDRTISYLLTLPIPTWLIPIKMAIYYASASMMIGVFSIPACKLIFYNQFDFSVIAWPKFILVYLLTNLFFGFFAVLLATTLSDSEVVDHIWARFVFPLWFFGGFQFTWFSLYKLYPWIAYADLLNPVIFITEGIRAVMIGQEGYLPFWFCVIMLVLFIVSFAIIAIKRLKRQLDFV